MTNSVTADDLSDVLVRWASGTLSPEAVQAWAEERYAVDGYSAESSAVNEVLGRLDRLDMDLTTVEDVPALLNALTATDHLDLLRSLDASINVESRKLSLRSDPFYAPFCKI